MRQKAAFKIVIDILMTLTLLFLMGYQFWGDKAHEWAGAGMFFLFIVHHILNGRWYKNVFRGRLSPSRIFQLIVDLLVLLAMIGLMVSGVLLSRYVFPIRGWIFRTGFGAVSFGRLLHMAASHWGFVLMAAHLGIHWGMFMGLARKALRLKRGSAARRILMPLIGTLVAVYGLTVFIRRDLPTYMLVKTQFVFLDFSEPIPLFYLDYLAMMGTFVFIAYYLTKFLLNTAQKKKAGDSADGG